MSYVPKKAQSVADTLRNKTRRIVVTGASGVGKTTLSVSASKLAGDTIPASKRIDCADVAVIQCDNEGVIGAVRAGLVPRYVYDLSDVTDWVTYKKRLSEALFDLKPLADGGELSVVIVDLAAPSRLCHRHVDPQKINEWIQITKEGEDFYRAFNGLANGVTIIGNCQLKASQTVAETSQSVDASNAKSVGGERSKFTADLLKGIASIWLENASLWFVRELKRKRGMTAEDVGMEYFTHTQSSAKFEAKSRFRDVLKPTEPGSRTLRSMLTAAYGDIT